MPDPVFPTLSRSQDSKNLSIELEDKALKTEMEGGYVVTRAKHTRKPRRKFTSGFSQLTDADKATLENFWDAVGGGSVIFDWTEPSSNTVYKVRFAAPLAFKYTGVGGTNRWDVTFTLDQA